MSDSNELILTVICTTYNQSRYIRECLEGIVMQQTNFKFEAVVHDDASTDDTPNIIREFERKYPDIIKPIYEEENQYSKKDGSLERILDSHTHGKYVALCEGDDYWTDPEKLQRQFDMMEEHPDWSCCFHKHSDLLPSGRILEMIPQKIASSYTVDDIINFQDGLIATASMFYRNMFLQKEEKPEFWAKCDIGDIPTKLYLASKGPIGFIDRNMCVYRRRAAGSWTLNQSSLKIRFTHDIRIQKMYYRYNKYTKGKYSKTIYCRMLSNLRYTLWDVIRTPFKRIMPHQWYNAIRDGVLHPQDLE